MLERIRAYLTARLGPLPIWAWLAIVIVLIAAVVIWRRRNAGGSDTSSTYSGPGLAPNFGDPPLISDPVGGGTQVGGGRTEPGYTGPNSSVPPWLAPTDFPPGVPGGWATLPPITTPELPSFSPIPSMDGRLTTAQIETARDRFSNVLFPTSPTQNVLAPTLDASKTVQKAPAQSAMSPAPANTVAKVPSKTVTKLPAKTGGVGLNRPQSSGRLT